MTVVSHRTIHDLLHTTAFLRPFTMGDKRKREEEPKKNKAKAVEESEEEAVAEVRP